MKDIQARVKANLFIDCPVGLIGYRIVVFELLFLS